MIVPVYLLILSVVQTEQYILSAYERGQEELPFLISLSPFFELLHSG